MERKSVGRKRREDSIHEDKKKVPDLPVTTWGSQSTEPLIIEQLELRATIL